MEAGHAGLTGIAVVALAALVCGLFLERLRQPSFVGYIVAGVMLGPSGFALVENRDQIDTLADLGVLMLLFVIGMELSIRVFMRMWRLALTTTLAQIAAATVVTLLLSIFTGWPFGMALLLGFCIALSSTAAAIKIFEDTGELKRRPGLIGVGVLITQDVAFVPMILILGVISVGQTAFHGLFAVAGSVGILAALLWYLARGNQIRLPFGKAFAANPELATLTALAVCFGAASLSGVLGMSPAYGAFLAGLVIGNSDHRPQLLEGSKPIQSVLIMVFFLSIGLLIDVGFIWDNLWTVLLVLFIVAIFKTAMNTVILRFLGQPWTTAFLTSAILAQIGEFSFLLSRTGLETGLIGEDTMRLVVAVTVLSLALSPMWVVTVRRVHRVTRTGVETFGQLLMSVYRREAELLARAARFVGPKVAVAGGQIAGAAKGTMKRRAKAKDKEKEKEPETGAPVETSSRTHVDEDA